MTLDERCRCGGTGTATAVVSLRDAVLLDDRPCPAGCLPPGVAPRADAMAAYLDAEERRLVTAGGGNVDCGHCQDFRTDVTDGREHPCRHCQPDAYEAWRAAEARAAVS